MGFDSVFNGDPTTPRVTASGKASSGIDLSSGQVYFQDDIVGGWQKIAGGSSGPVTSDDVANESGVTGATVTAALNALNIMQFATFPYTVLTQDITNGYISRAITWPKVFLAPPSVFWSVDTTNTTAPVGPYVNGGIANNAVAGFGVQVLIVAATGTNSGPVAGDVLVFNAVGFGAF